MARSLMSVHGADSDFDPANGKFGGYASAQEAEAAMAATGLFNQKLVDEGHFVFAGGLRSASTATVVDAAGDKTAFTDGPYLESKEWIGGFWIIEAPDLDVALELAAEASKACGGAVEVRPFAG
jgi:hypothetical protein